MTSTHMMQSLIAATEQVFEAMVFRPVTPGEPMDGTVTPKADIVGTVALAGPTSGVVAFLAPAGAARTIASAMLGIPEPQINGEARDAIGEITNMIAGTFRNTLKLSGGDWSISVPTVTAGTDLVISYLPGVDRLVCPFTMDQNRVYVELVLKHD